jgi:hypothetical protein
MRDQVEFLCRFRANPLPNLRLMEDLKLCQIYDYVDIHVGTLEKMYRKRLAAYIPQVISGGWGIF